MTSSSDSSPLACRSSRSHSFRTAPRHTRTVGDGIRTNPGVALGRERDEESNPMLISSAFPVIERISLSDLFSSPRPLPQSTAVYTQWSSDKISQCYNRRMALIPLAGRAYMSSEVRAASPARATFPALRQRPRYPVPPFLTSPFPDTRKPRVHFVGPDTSEDMHAVQ